MNLQIRQRRTGAVLFECELPPEVAGQPAGCQLGYAVREAHKTGANLEGAPLTGAVLDGANLEGANLSFALLRGANLEGANLEDADLTGALLTGALLEDAVLAEADLRGADLRNADLMGADLRDADLDGANLEGANLSFALLRGANLEGAVLDGADLTEAVLAEADLTGAAPAALQERYAARAQRYRARNPDVPVIPNIDLQILDAINRGQGELRMDDWHTCQTAHCLAGWAVTLAGKEGLALERLRGTDIAARMIYTASIGHAPDFFASDELALQGLRKRAAEQTAALSAPSLEGPRPGGGGRS